MAVQSLHRTEQDRRPGIEPDAGARLWSLPDWWCEPGGSGLHLSVLGSPQLRLAGRPIALRTRKTLALLTYLAIQRGPQPREHLADLFWPGADIGDARASLRTALSYIRQGLGSEVDTYLSTTRESVGLHPSAAVELDVQALAEAHRRLRQPLDPDSLRRQLEVVLAVPRRTFLAGVSLPDAPDFEAWLEGQRAHWRGLEAALLDRLATLQTEDGDDDAACITLERWTQVSPDDDAAWQRLIDRHLCHGDGAGARRVWKEYRKVLAELDAEPSPHVMALADRIGTATALHAVPPISPSARSAHAGLDSLALAGPAREWSALLAAFERVRCGRPEVVILDGAAGTGKSRLIAQLALSLKQNRADVLVGRALDTEDELPYAAVVDALRARLDEENAPDDLLGDLWLAELARLLPELSERYPDLPTPVNDPLLGRSRTFEAVARLGEALAHHGPLLIGLEDVQWTDRSTRDLVRYAVRRWAACRAPVLLVLSIRSEDLETDRKLTPWLRGLERDVRTLRLSLDPPVRADRCEGVDNLADHPHCLWEHPLVGRVTQSTAPVQR